MISKEIFGQIRKIMPFRLTGNKKDFIAVGSDSGRIVILEVNLEKRFYKNSSRNFWKDWMSKNLFQETTSHETLKVGQS